MILPFEPYDPLWKDRFAAIANELGELLAPFGPSIDHIGSTAVEGLSAKPIIDILIGTQNESDLDQVPRLLAGKNYVYYEKYNADMPYRRFFVLLKESPSDLSLPALIAPGDPIPEKSNDHAFRLAHIHVIPSRSEHWIRHIAFRDYLLAHPATKHEYQALKEKLVRREWNDGNDYNEAKDAFMKKEERNAVAWYLDKAST